MADKREYKIALVCHGRGEYGEAVLQEGVQAEVHLRSSSVQKVCTQVECPYSSGPHGEFCRAAANCRAFCPYVFDYPHILNFDSEWQPPAAIAHVVRTLLQRK